MKTTWPLVLAILIGACSGDRLPSTGPTPDGTPAPSASPGATPGASPRGSPVPTPTPSGTPGPASRWEGIGGSDAGGGISDGPRFSGNIDLKLDAKANPHVVWADKDTPSGKYQIAYAFWNGSAWGGLDDSEKRGGLGAAFSPDAGNAPSLALDSDGNPHVAWSGKKADNSGTSLFYVYWNGTAWVGLGGSEDGTIAAPCDNPSLTLDSKGRPNIAFTTKASGTTGTSVINFVYWNGSAWAEYGGSATARGLSKFHQGGADLASLALDSRDYPHVVFDAHFATSGSPRQIYYIRWNGAGWEGIGGSAEDGGLSRNGQQEATGSSLALDKEGRPYVAFGKKSDFSADGQLNIGLLYWDGTAWAQLGSSNSSGGISSLQYGAAEPKVVIGPKGEPHIAYYGRPEDPQKGRFFHKYWDGSKWGTLGKGEFGANVGIYSSRTGLALDSYGRPVIAWQENVNGDNLEVYLQAWR